MKRKIKGKVKKEVQRRKRQEGRYTWRYRMMKNGVPGGSLKEQEAGRQRVRRCRKGSLQRGDRQSLQSHRQRSQQSLQPAARSRCLRRHGRSEPCGTFHHGRKGKEEVYPNKELIKDKNNTDLYYQKRKAEYYLNKSTRDKDNSNLYYQKKRGKKEDEISERKEGSGDKKESKDKDKEKKERKEEKERKKYEVEKERKGREKESGLDKNKVKEERKGREKESGLDKYNVKRERKGREKKGGLDKYKTKCERKKEKKEGKEEKEKNMDTIEVKCAQVSLCGAARVEQKEVGSPKLWKSCFESESIVVKLLLVVILAVSMYMFGVAEHSLKNMILDNATWQDWYLSGRWQDWHLSKSDRDRHPSRKGLSKANGFRKRRHVKRRLALVGQVFKIVLFICMDTVHAMQHGPDNNPDLVANGPAGSAEAPSADQVLTQVLRQNTEALQKLALSGSGSEVSRNLESASRILKNPDYFGSGDCTEAQFGLWKHQFSNWLTFGDARFRTLLETAEGQSRESTMEDFTAEGKALSRKLYRILTSYLKGPALSITRAVRQTENGFLVWQRLNAEYRPLSRQRGMALAQVLATSPAFPKDKSVMECVLALEEVVHQYNQVTGEEYPKSLLMGTLIRCSPPHLRQHLQLTLQDSSTYKSVKETMLLYEKTTKAWSSESVLREVGATQGSKQHDEPTPMEVDQVQGHHKGKGKGKGKGKTKGKSSWSTWEFGAGSAWKGRGRGKGKGGRKGKGKAKERKAKEKQKETKEAREVKVAKETIGAGCVARQAIGEMSAPIEW